MTYSLSLSSIVSSLKKDNTYNVFYIFKNSKWKSHTYQEIALNKTYLDRMQMEILQVIFTYNWGLQLLENEPNFSLNAKIALGLLI